MEGRGLTVMSAERPGVDIEAVRRDLDEKGLVVLEGFFSPETVAQ